MGKKDKDTGEKFCFRDRKIFYFILFLKGMGYFKGDNLFAGLYNFFNILWDFQLLFEQSWGLIFEFIEKSI